MSQHRHRAPEAESGELWAEACLHPFHHPAPEARVGGEEHLVPEARAEEHLLLLLRLLHEEEGDRLLSDFSYHSVFLRCAQST